MNNMIKNYIAKLTKEQIASFALMHNIVLNDQELNFTYDFVKQHGEEALSNFDNFNIEAYKDNYTADNFGKIKALFKEYSEKFKPFLNM